MKQLLCLLLSAATSIYGFAQQGSWKMRTLPIATQWSSQVDPLHAWTEYPRPQLQRNEWNNLNGLWQYAILPMAAANAVPGSFDGQILVPFAVESALSGVGKTVGKDSVLWYLREFELPERKKQHKLLLHFGAVDWQADVYVNGQLLGRHQGGYDGFSFDITPYLKKGKKQSLAVCVWDPTDQGPQPRGKQVVKPRGIWYNSVTGIWQTVWMEWVADLHVNELGITPDIDKGIVSIQPNIANFNPVTDELQYEIWDGANKLLTAKGVADAATNLSIYQPHLWSPDDPFLYDLKVKLIRNGRTADELKSYFAMRKISMAKDENGIQRMMLNNHFLFQIGPLDQGWWPDGLYTAPNDEALKYDIVKTKEMGFNMIRKHVKVEPERWYYHCDKLGMLVWQDMPSGDLGNKWERSPGIYGGATDRDRSAESEAIYRHEWNAIMSQLKNHPSIVVWVPFNEAWGQFKTREIVEWTMEKDPSRLVNPASGGNFVHVGHIIDLHNYPEPLMPDPQLFGADRVLVLGEFGGLGLPLENHTWQDKNNWGYRSFKNSTELLERYTEYWGQLPDLIMHGLSAAVYTQTTDVEGEVNGLMTYDRKIVKMPEEELKKLNEKLHDPSLVKFRE